MTVAKRLTLCLGTVQVLAWATTYYLPAVIAGRVAASLHVSTAAVLGGFSCGLLVSGLCAPLTGRWIERSGGRPVLATGCLVQAAGLVLLSATQSLPWWYGTWLVLGAGMSLGLYDAAFATAGRMLGGAARPTIIGITLLGGFASTVGWPLGTRLFALYGWRATALAYAAVHLAVNLPLVLLLVPRRPPAPATPARAAAAGAAPPRRVFWLLATFFTLRSAISGVIVVHVLTLLAALGLSQGEAVVAAALIGPAQVGARVLEWCFGRNVSPLLTGWIGAALLPLGILLPLFGLPPLSFTLSYGVSNGILTISRGTLPLHLLGPDGYAVTLGRIALPVLLAQAAAPTLAAPLVARLPVAWILWATAAMGTLAFLCLLPLRAGARPLRPAWLTRR